MKTRNMPKKDKYHQLSTTVTPTFERVLKKHVYLNDTTKGRMLEKYLDAYLRELEHKKLVKKMETSICQCLVCKNNNT